MAYERLGVAAVAVIVAIFIVLLVIFRFVPLGLWIQALTSGAPVSIGSLIGMRLRKVPPQVIVSARITAAKAGLGLTTDQLEAQYLARGNVDQVVAALI